MENTNNKVVTVSFIAAGVLLGITAYVLMDAAAAVATGSVGKFFGNDLVRHGLPVAVGLITFFVLQFNKKVVEWGIEVVAELRRIVWPSRKDTTSMTIMVCVMLIVSGLLLGFLDVVSASVVDWLLHHNFLGIFA